jgi:hypothetical protein
MIVDRDIVSKTAQLAVLAGLAELGLWKPDSVGARV